MWKSTEKVVESAESDVDDGDREFVIVLQALPRDFGFGSKEIRRHRGHVRIGFNDMHASISGTEIVVARTVLA